MGKYPDKRRVCLNCSEFRKQEFGVSLWFFVRSRENAELEKAEKRICKKQKGSVQALKLPISVRAVPTQGLAS